MINRSPKTIRPTSVALIGLLLLVPLWAMAAVVPTASTVQNQAPSFTSGPSDGGSDSATPTTVGANVTFTATVTEANHENWYLAICKTNSITPVNNGAPTCPGGSWAISTSTAYDATATATYTALIGDASQNAWYAFACDYASASACTAMSQGTGSTGSPFDVNHAPTFGTVAVTDSTGGTVEPGDLVKFTLAHPAQIADSDTAPSQDTVSMSICTSAASDYACTGGTAVCSVTGVDPATTDVTCTESTAVIAPGSATRGTANFKVFVKDVHNLAGTGTGAQSFTIQNSAPTHDTPELDVHAPVTANSVASWQFEDGASATSFDDETTNANNGTCTNCPTWTQTGYSGGAYAFDGTNDSVNVGDKSSLDFGTGDFTILGWVKTTSSAGQMIASKYNAYPLYYLSVSSGVLTARIGYDAGNNVITSGGTAINDGNWHFVAAVFDRGGNLSRYVDGSAYGTPSSISSLASLSIDNTNSFRIGSDGAATPGNLFTGSLDEIHTYNRVLTSTEITALYNAYTTPGTTSYTTSAMDLSCKAVNTADHDNDPFTTIINWKKDGTSITALNLPFDSNVTSTTTGAVKDYSGNLNHATLGSATTTPTWSSSGIRGGAYSFDGGDCMSVADNATLRLTSNLTLEAWINVNAFTSWGGIVGRADSTFGAYAMQLGNTNQKLRFSYNIASPWTNFIDSNSNIPQATWTHVAVTYDGSNVRHYINGVLDKTTPLTVTLSSTAYPVSVGCDPPGTNEYFNGKIDEVRIYNRALSSAQITQNYNNGKPLYNTLVQEETLASDSNWSVDVALNDAQIVNPDSIVKASNAIDPSVAPPVLSSSSTRVHSSADSGKVLEWRFEDGSGATAFDDQTNANNNGSCTNCPTWSQEGLIGGTYQFDGTNDQVVDNTFATPISGANVSMSFWAKPMANGHNGSQSYEYDIMVGKSGLNLSRDLTVGIRADNKIRVFAENTVGTSTLDSTSAITVGQWIQITVTGGTNSYCLYLNGTLNGCSTFATDFYIDRLGVGNSNPNTWTTYYNGFVDELNLYNRTLSAAEIKNLYSSTAYAYGNYDLGTSPAGVTVYDGATPIACSVDWREDGTSLAMLNLPFNENVTSTTAGAVRDMSTYGNNATLGDGNASYIPTWTNATTCGNNTGGCYDFDSAGDYIQVPTGASFAGKSAGTISLWFKTDGYNSSNSALYFESTSASGYSRFAIFQLASGIVSAYMRDTNTGSAFAVSSSSPISTSVWHQAVATVDASTDLLILYIDGSEASRESSAKGAFTSDSSAQSISIGAFTPSTSHDGMIDEVRTYSRALTATEIAAQYNAGKANTQNLSNVETVIGDLFSSSLMCADANGAVSTQLTSNSVEILGFSTDVSDGGVSTNVGSAVTFTGTYNAASGRQWYLAVCKNPYVLAGSDAAPQCCSDATLGTCGASYAWAVSSAANDGAQASGSYTIQAGDASSNAWYGFGCDKVASVASCSPMTQGSGNTGSPFTVNQAPALGTVAIGPTCGSSASVDPGNARSAKIITDMTGVNDYLFSVAIQSDGKIVAVGQNDIDNNADFAVARYHADGTLDSSFGTGGKVTTPIGSLLDAARGVGIQPDGKIVVVGTTSIDANNWPIALVRYNSDGSLDTSFDTDGKVTTPIGSCDNQAYSVAFQPDGKIVLAGVTSNCSNYDFLVIRYNSNGSLDTSFDQDGIVSTNFNWHDAAYAVSVQSDGKIVAVGRGQGSGYDFAIARYNSDGSLDTSFDTDGKLLIPIGGGDDEARALAILSDGKYLLGGWSHNGSNNDFAVARISSTGVLDTTFDTDGKQTTAIGSGDDSALSMALQADGKIVLAGSSNNGTDDDYALVRYTDSGALDTTFDGDGKQVTTLGSGTDIVYEVAIQSDQKIVVGGRSNSVSTYDFALVRYTSAGALDDLSGYACVSAGVTDADTSDTVNVYVCPSTTDHFNTTLNRCEDASNAEIAMLCSISGARSGDSAQCVMNGRVPVPTAHGSVNVLVYIEDSQSLPGTGTNTQAYSVTDMAPTISSAGQYSVSSITLVAGDSTAKSYTVTVTDDNGGNDLTGATGVLYDDDAVNLSSGTCSASELNCYPGVTCTGDTPVDEDRLFTCDFTVWFNANYNNASGQGWRLHVNPADDQGAVSNLVDSGAISTNSLLAINIDTATIPYGLLNLGETSSGIVATMQNVGNQAIDTLIQGSNMLQSGGSDSISAGQQHWHNTTQDFTYSQGNTLLTDASGGTSKSTGCADRDLAVRSVHDSTASDESIYFKLQIPSSLTQGSYSGTNTFLATASNTCSDGE